jgi:non-heme Fe2+,alpha-ketoglutarate-dependent halogenase
MNAVTDGLGGFGLTLAQVEFYEQQGYLGPFELCSEAEMTRIRAWIDATGFLDVDATSPIYGAPPPGERMVRDWHLVYPEILGLCTHPAILDRVAAIKGDDLVLWRSQFQYKGPGDGPMAWHQDLSFPGPHLLPALHPVRNISAWIAIDEATVANGCVHLVPPHSRHLQRRLAPVTSRPAVRSRPAIEYIVDTGNAIPMALRPGEFFLFSESLLHGSAGNPTLRRRLGLSVRFTTPDVRIYPGQTSDGQGLSLANYGAILVSGEDRYGLNAYIEPEFD